MLDIVFSQKIPTSELDVNWFIWKQFPPPFALLNHAPLMMVAFDQELILSL